MTSYWRSQPLARCLRAVRPTLVGYVLSRSSNGSKGIYFCTYYYIVFFVFFLIVLFSIQPNYVLTISLACVLAHMQASECYLWTFGQKSFLGQWRANNRCFQGGDTFVSNRADGEGVRNVYINSKINTSKRPPNYSTRGSTLGVRNRNRRNSLSSKSSAGRSTCGSSGQKGVLSPEAQTVQSLGTRNITLPQVIVPDESDVSAGAPKSPDSGKKRRYRRVSTVE